MTVCVAALASYTKQSSAVVCVADKLVSYGESITGETDQSKIIELNPSGMVCMTSGNEEGLTRYVASLLATEDFGKTAREVSKNSEEQYKTCLEELLKLNFLTPRLLTTDQFVAGISGPQINEYMKSVAEEVSNYNMESDLIISGYEERGEPFILGISHPGIVLDLTRTGFHAVGAGARHAIGKLATQEHTRKDSLPNAMYDVIDAKISAEVGPFVGYDWDTAVIVFSAGSPKRHIVPDEINKLLDRLWMTTNRTPFEKPYEEPPPRNWKKKLNDYAESILPGSSKKVK